MTGGAAKGALSCVIVVSAGLAGPAHAQVSADEANKSNNPLNPATAVNFQDQYTSRLYDSDRSTNDFLLRVSRPLPPGETIKVPQILRLTVPVSTRPELSGGDMTGLGDINIFDIFVLGRTAGGVEYGAGPLVTFPTASDDALGTGKWQAGLAGMAVHVTPRGVLGGLLQWQASLAGDKDRADVSTATFQPLFIHNLQDGWYLRSTGVWTFDLKNDHHWIPIGVGVGKVWKSGGTTFNLFAEPQWTVSHDGSGPKFSVFMGLNLTLGK